MHGRFYPGARVETVKPKVESKDWDAAAKLERRWGVLGHIREEKGTHGTVFKVEHEDGSFAWYEPRELVSCAEHQDYTPEERAEMIRKMKGVAASYYSLSAIAGIHALIEFTGLMNEYITVCEEAHSKGVQFPFANTHNDVPLPFKEHHLAYLAEKLNCIYGPSLFGSDELRHAFISGLFDGAYKLVPNHAKPVPHDKPVYDAP